MQFEYVYTIANPPFDKLGYVVAVANLNDKHDRSTPSHFHWKILKCRMIIFSNSSVLACPDKNEVKRVHIIFNKVGDDYDKLNSLFLTFSLSQEGEIRKTTHEVYEMCFQYTMTAKIAPVLNTLGNNYLINNRDFLTAVGPQEGVKFYVSSTYEETTLQLKPVKIHFTRTDENFSSGECIRVLPSLNKAVVEQCYDSMPESAKFKTYKDLRRHWKNIHGYRLPEAEGSYCTVQFWRGEPLTYPKICVTRNFPVITPIPKKDEKIILGNFLNCLKVKVPNVLGIPLKIQQNCEHCKIPAQNGTCIHFLNDGNGITRDGYSDGYCLMAFDLTPDLSANSTTHWNLIRHGSVRLEVRFESALTRTVNCIVYAEFDNIIEIDKNRNVNVDFSS